MADSYRPDHRRRSHYYDSDNPDDTRSRGRGRYDDDSRSRGDVSRERAFPAPRLDYDPVDPDSSDYYDDRFKVCNPQYNAYTRSDDLRHGQDRPRYFEGREVPRAPDVDALETGEKDVSSDGSPLKFVLVRGLKPSVLESRFAKDMEKFYQDYDEVPGGAQAKSLRRVLLIRERRSDQSLGYGFAEYHSLKDAQAVVRKAPEMRKANKCTISSAEITLDFPHNGVFPHADYGVSEYNKRFTFEMGNSGRRHKYRDERYYASEYMVNPEPLDAPKSVSGNDSSGEKKSVKAGNKRGIETLESKSKKAKSSASAAPAFLQHWQSKAAELRGESEKPVTEESKEPASGVNTIQTSEPSSTATEDEQTFAYEGEKSGCYLCGSEFSSKDKLIQHLNQSTLHANNLKDSKLVYRGYERLKKKGIDPDSTIRLPKTPATAPATIDANYRDRAAERRENEVKKVGFSLKGVNQKPHSKKAGHASASSSDNEQTKPSYGKGLNMLQKSGWTEGDSLGAGGGITAPIDQNLYAAGVGLGHESSKKGDAVEEAGRMTKGERGEFLEKTKELARKRYEQM